MKKLFLMVLVVVTFCGQASGSEEGLHEGLKEMLQAATKVSAMASFLCGSNTDTLDSVALGFAKQKSNDESEYYMYEAYYWKQQRDYIIELADKNLPRRDKKFCKKSAARTEEMIKVFDH